RRVGTPPLEHADVNRLVDVGVTSVLPNLRILANGSKKGRRNLGVQSPGKLPMRVGNLPRQSISVQGDLRTEREPVQFRLLHHPTQRSLSEKIGLIAASHIGMRTYKPALFDGRERARRRDDRVRIFGMTNGP